MTDMKVLSQKEFEEKIANFRIGLEHFPGTATIRLTPPKQCHLLSIIVFCAVTIFFVSPMQVRLLFLSGKMTIDDVKRRFARYEITKVCDIVVKEPDTKT